MRISSWNFANRLNSFSAFFAPLREIISHAEAQRTQRKPRLFQHLFQLLIRIVIFSVDFSQVIAQLMVFNRQANDKSRSAFHNAFDGDRAAMLRNDAE